MNVRMGFVVYNPYDKIARYSYIFNWGLVMTVTLEAVTKKLLNEYFKTQPALNKPGVPAAFSGVLLGNIVEAALNHPKPSLDTVTHKLLNDFQKTQPALQRSGAPAANSGILLGDLLNQALSGVGSFSTIVNSPAHGLASSSLVVVSGASKAVLNGAQTTQKVDAKHISIHTTSSPGTSGTLSWHIGASGKTYSVSGVGPFLVTVTSLVAHGLASGAIVSVANGTDASVNGPQTITVIDTLNFSFSMVAAPAPGTLDWAIDAIGVLFVCQVMDPVVKKLLNDFQKTQPALQKVGVPAANSGILLGDLIGQALS